MVGGGRGVERDTEARHIYIYIYIHIYIYIYILRPGVLFAPPPTMPRVLDTAPRARHLPRVLDTAPRARHLPRVLGIFRGCLRRGRRFGTRRRIRRIRRIRLISRKWNRGAVGAPIPSRAGGQDDVSSKETPSNEPPRGGSGGRFSEDVPGGGAGLELVAGFAGFAGFA